jgi:hypothetical protein
MKKMRVQRYDLNSIHPEIKKFIETALLNNFLKSDIFIPNVKKIEEFLQAEEESGNMNYQLVKMADVHNRTKLLDIITLYIKNNEYRKDIFHATVHQAITYLTQRLDSFENYIEDKEITICLVYKSTKSFHLRYAMKLTMKDCKCYLDLFQITTGLIVSAGSEIWY